MNTYYVKKTVLVAIIFSIMGSAYAIQLKPQSVTITNNLLVNGQQTDISLAPTYLQSRVFGLAASAACIMDGKTEDPCKELTSGNKGVMIPYGKTLTVVIYPWTSAPDTRKYPGIMIWNYDYAQGACHFQSTDQSSEVTTEVQQPDINKTINSKTMPNGSVVCG